MSIRMQADDFLDAYRALEKHSENVSLTTMGPAVVNLAFAVELYVKDVYCTLDLKPPRGKDGHNILALFEKLPEPVRQEIFLHEAISQNPFHTRGDLLSTKIFSREYTPYERFCDQVKAISDAFVQWRYPYEQKTKSLRYDSSFALALIEALKVISDKIRSRPAA